MTADREIELKFLCAPQDFDAVAAAAPPGEDRTRELVSVYYDTPDRALETSDATLRVRTAGGRRVQTFKRGTGFSREEREAPLAGKTPDAAMAPLPDLTGGKPLAAQFEVGVTRRQRTLSHDGAVIELALDQGEIRAGQAVLPLSEVELELKSGDEAALFALARDLAGAAPLYLSFDPKAARGQALRDGTLGEARHRARLVLAKDAAAGEAFQATARAALAQIAANAVLLREAASPEAVHQLRVATRRLRSAMAIFRPVVESAARDPLRDEARWLAHACDAARNLEVFAGGDLRRLRRLKLSGPARTSLKAAVSAALAAAQGQVAEAVSSARFRSFMLEAAAWAETGDWRARSEAAEPARAFAAAVLDRRLRRVFKRGRKLAHGSDEDRHALRIEAKKLRYSAEAFAALYPPTRSERFLKPLRGLQDALGTLNDQATARAVVAALTLPPEVRAATEAALQAHGGASKAKLLARAGRALDGLEDARRFWVT